MVLQIFHSFCIVYAQYLVRNNLYGSFRLRPYSIFFEDEFGRGKAVYLLFLVEICTEKFFLLYNYEIK